jgi:hypothetical protein
LTDAERAKEEAWQRKRELAARRKSRDDNVFRERPSFPEWDYHPTGQIHVTMGSLLLRRIAHG